MSESNRPFDHDAPGPNRGDGRNIDPERGLLTGEGAQQVAPPERTRAEGGEPYGVWAQVPSDPASRADATYYDLPVLKQPTWIWAVPAYFYAGGAAGAAAVLGAAAQLSDRPGLSTLVTRCRWIAAIGGAVGTALLIHDLGRPARFLNMLRVVRPSSPMNMGSWILASAAPVAAGSAVLGSASGVLGAVGDAAGLGAGVLGGPLAGYPGVLLSGTAVPVWQATRTATPPAFVASAVMAAAGVLQTMKLSDREHGIVRRFAVAGAIGELLAERLVQRDAASVERVARPLHEGASGAMLRAAKALTVSSLVLNLVPGRRWRWAAGLSATAASLGFKFGMFEAGKASAADPRATFYQQRAGFGGAEATGRAAVAGA
ncbi:MAG: NrfD/PsrC family molybdoenzyme membrane anchor subunit [Actinomycetota bacterium]